MKPTQAQIEAAAKAIRDVEEPDMPVYEFMKHAQAALTAAAEARYSEPQGTGFQAGEAEPAAAEAEEKPEFGFGPPETAAAEAGDTWPAKLVEARIEEAITATIERCAQVAETYFPFGKVNGKEIAAAIRAMKEQP